MRPKPPRRAGSFRDASGVSAVEFSLICPLLVAIFLAAIELPRAYTVHKRLDLAASTLADMLSRREYTDLQPVYAIASAITDPYDTSAAKIALTTAGTYALASIGAARVCSSAALNGGRRAVGSSLGTPPAGLSAYGDRFVMVEVAARYTPIVPLFPALTSLDLTYKKILPVREGKVHNGRPEVVLPGGHPCPFL